MIDLFKIVELNLGDIIIICLVQIGINILSFAIGQKAGVIQTLDKILEYNKELDENSHSCSKCGEELIFGECPNCYPDKEPDLEEVQSY